MIIDPWGTVLASCPDQPSVAIAEIDLARVRTLRSQLPSLEHGRPETYRVTDGHDGADVADHARVEGKYLGP